MKDTGTEQSVSKSWWRNRDIYIGLLGLSSFILLAVLIGYNWELVHNLGAYGYIGAWVVSLLGSATIIVPVPALPAIFTLGAVMKYPFLVGIAVGLAEPFGELTGYMAGRGGGVALKNKRIGFYNRIEGMMERKGGRFLILFGSLPNPFFDMAGIAAGAIRYPVWKFLVYTWMGKTIKGMLIAYAGFFGLRSILHLWGMEF